MFVLNQSDNNEIAGRPVDTDLLCDLLQSVSFYCGPSSEQWFVLVKVRISGPIGVPRPLRSGTTDTSTSTNNRLIGST